MKKHTKIYMQFFDYDECDFIPSEINGNKAQDIHHIDNRGSGGSDSKDTIENLMALTRTEHLDLGDKPQYMFILYKKHIMFIHHYRPDYEINFNNIPLAYRDELKQWYNILIPVL